MFDVRAAGKGRFQRGYKPNFVRPCERENHLSQQPIPGTHRISPKWSGQLRGPLFGLAPGGVFRAASLALSAVVSYTTFSPLPKSRC